MNSSNVIKNAPIIETQLAHISTYFK